MSIAISGAERRLGNAAVFAGAEVLSRLIAFLATAHLAAALGPGPFGVLGFAFAVVGFLTVFVEGGFVDVGSREIARLQTTEEVRGLSAAVSVVRLIVAVACLLALVLASPLLQPTSSGRLVLNLTGLLLLMAALDAAWVYKGRGEGVRVGISLMMRRVLYAVLIFALIRGPDDLLKVPFAQVAGEIVGIVWLGAMLLYAGLPLMDLRKGWDTFRSSGSLLVAKLARASVVTLDVVLLGLMATDRDVGLYAAPYRICFFLMALAAAISVAYLPDVVTAEGPERVRAAGRHAAISGAVGIPAAVGGIVVAEPLLTLVFGPEYAEGARAMQIILAGLSTIFVFAPVHNVLLAQGRVHVETRAMVVAAVLNVVLNFFWIPRYGIVGAASATLVSEILILGLSAVALSGPMIGALLRGLGAPVAASAVMAGTLLLIRTDVHVLLLILLGAVVYAIALSVLGLPEDLRAGLRRIGRRKSK